MKVKRKVSEYEVIRSFFNELNFNLEAVNMHFTTRYTNSKLVNLYHYGLLLARRDLTKNTIIIATSGLTTTINEYLTALTINSNIPTIVIFIKYFNFTSVKQNLHHLLEDILIEDIKNNGKDLDNKVNNLINYLEYYEIDRNSKGYEEAFILIDKYIKK